MALPPSTEISELTFVVQGCLSVNERWSTKKTWEPPVSTPSHYMSRVFKQEFGGGGGVGKGMLPGILGGGPDPISDQKISFSTPVFRPGSGCSNALLRINCVLTFNTIQRITN